MRSAMSVMVVWVALAGSARADEGRFECRIDVGVGVLKAEPDLEPATAERIHVGGCTLREIEARSHVVSTEVPEGCRLQADDDDDIQADRGIYPGSGLEVGAELMAFCDAGILDASVAATLADASCGDGFCDSLEGQSCAADCSCAGLDQCWGSPPGGGCRCDSVCVFIGDCCGDACTECGACEEVVCGDGICDANGGDCDADCTCASHEACERGAPNDYRCFCTSDCMEYGDCCPDFCDVCGGC